MFKVAIVDDEFIARKTLEKYFEIYASDFEVSEMFDNGEDLIEYLKNNNVDVVFTDVKMPGITGIEVAKWIYENKPEIKVVIVSGYSEFQWAQEAMRYRVVYYILKVVDVKEFVGVIEFIRNELRLKKSDESTMDLQKFFYDLVFGIFKTEDEVKRIFNKTVGVDAEDTTCCVVSVVLEEDEKNDLLKGNDDDDFEKALGNFIKMLYDADNVSMVSEKSGEYKFIILHTGDTLPYISPEEIENEISAVLNIKVGIDSVKEMSVIELYHSVNDISTNDDKRKFIISESMEKQEFKTELVERVRQYIDEHYIEEISRKVIADRFSMNADYLGRKFKEITGKSIIEYIQEKRIERARQLILENVELDNICTMVGYFDSRSFKRLFKKFTGIGLREYKDRIKKEENLQ